MFTWLLLMRKEFGAHEKPRTPAELGPSGQLSPVYFLNQTLILHLYLFKKTMILLFICLVI